MTLPNFLIIGAQKSGTTWFGEILHQHPDIFVAPHEIHFFDKDYNFRKGLAWYEAHFRNARRERAVGEKTPDYFWPNGRGTDGHQPDVHRLLHRTLPDARLVVILRDPVERAISAARHLVMDGWVSPFLSLDDLLAGPAASIAEEHGVIDYGRYARHLDAYFELFRREQVLVCVYEEDVVQDPQQGLRKVCDFLGVDATHEFRGLKKRRNELRKSVPRLLIDRFVPIVRGQTAIVDRLFPPARYEASEATRDKLRELYAPENERLYRALGRKPSGWR